MRDAHAVMADVLIEIGVPVDRIPIGTDIRATRQADGSVRITWDREYAHDDNGLIFTDAAIPEIVEIEGGHVDVRVEDDDDA